jgi:ATP diphosphatase
VNDIGKLLDIMRRLRDPQKGCPWDIEQSFHSIAPYTVEEAYEVADAIERGDIKDLADELGDLLFQVVFHSQIATEQGLFQFDDVVKAICEKLVRRHPHVFADENIKSAEEQTLAWEEHKARERQSSDKYHSVLDGIAKTLPGLTRAAKLQKRAAKVGFDWNTVQPIFDKLSTQPSWARVEEELGDLLFTVVNIARHIQIDPELAMRRANAKFEARFNNMENAIERAGKKLGKLSSEQLEDYWIQVKRDEKL